MHQCYGLLVSAQELAAAKESQPSELDKGCDPSAMEQPAAQPGPPFSKGMSPVELEWWESPECICHEHCDQYSDWSREEPDI